MEEAKKKTTMPKKKSTPKTKKVMRKNPQFVTRAFAAQLLGLGGERVGQLSRERKLPAVDCLGPGGKIRRIYRYKDVMNFKTRRMAFKRRRAA